MCTCNESGGRQRRTADDTAVATDVPVQPIKAVVQPGFEHKVAIRLVPGRDILKVPDRLGCQPRGDRPPRPWPTGLSPELATQLAAANTKMIGWLTSDESNATRFIDDPVGALQDAGIELSRADLKAVSRTHAAVREDAVLPPGTALVGLTVSATRRGKIGDVDPAQPRDRTHLEPAGSSPVKPTRRTCGC